MMRSAVLLSLVYLLSPCAWSRVFIRWTQPAIPPVQVLGVRDLVISWDGGHAALLKAAILEGYHVYAEVKPGEAEAAAKAAADGELAGIIVKSEGITLQADSASGRAIDSLIRQLQSAHPGISVRLLEPGGKQPQMRGTTVVERDGVLEVSSPTQQPWIDSNVAFIRFEDVYRPQQGPLVDFRWNLADSVEQKYGPPTADYELAVAEAGAFHSDLILPLHPYFEERLASQDPQALTSWTKIRRYIRFYSRERREGPIQSLSNVGIVTDDYESSYEAMNLMARHNIPFRVLRPDRLKANLPDSMALLVIFSPMETAAALEVHHFASRGGIAVCVGSKGHFPWNSSRPIHQNSQSAIYQDGAGKVVEVAAPITNPEPFAQDIWRLLPPAERQLSLWNALTTLAAAYQNRSGSEIVVNLVNYSGQAIRVQVRIKGSFRQIRYETPERGCCVTLSPAHRDGFTEFIVPSLITGGRVHLNRDAGQ